MAGPKCIPSTWWSSCAVSSKNEWPSISCKEKKNLRSLTWKFVRSLHSGSHFTKAKISGEITVAVILISLTECQLLLRFSRMVRSWKNVQIWSDHLIIIEAKFGDYPLLLIDRLLLNYFNEHTIMISTPSETIRKPTIFWWFQGESKLINLLNIKSKNWRRFLNFRNRLPFTSNLLNFFN